MKDSKAITLIALIITIIVLIVVASVTVVLVFGNDGIIEKAKQTSFIQKFSEVQEKVELYFTNEEMKTAASGITTTTLKKLPHKDQANSDNFSETLLEEIKQISGKEAEELDLYFIDRKKINGYSSSHDFIIDVETLQLYDVQGEKFSGKWHHTLYGVGSDGNNNQASSATTAQTDEEITFNGDIGWLKPDMTGFNLYYTYVVYYTAEGDSKEVQLAEFLNNGRKSEIVENVGGVDKTYIFDGYKDKMWANVKTIANNLESWWVWQPRYAYKINESDSNTNVIFIDTQNKPLGSRYEGKYTINNDGTITIVDVENESGNYIIHPGFSIIANNNQNKELQGIWTSKYEPSETLNVNHNADFVKCYSPNLSGFDKEYTFIELYNTSTGEFEETSKLAELSDQQINEYKNPSLTATTKWYDYSKKIWANIKTYANGLESWWVWQPRYAYYVNETIGEVDIIFVDTNNKPYDKEKYGDTLPSGYKVHPGFNVTDEHGNAHKLEGIWMSKYEPSEVLNTNHYADSGVCLEPDLTGFDENNTYIELYNSSTGEFIDDTNYKLSDVKNNLGELNSNDNIKWYDYRNKIWANIKTYANNLECWWVWQPRYAYYISETNNETDVIFIDLNNKPVDTETYGNELPEGYTVHPGFTIEDENGNTKQLKGIWMSKYEPSWVND